MNLQKKVLPNDFEEAKRLIHFINDSMTNQWKMIKANNLDYLYWVKEGRRARRELAELYRKKERYDQEQDRVRMIVQNLQSRGIDASVVARAHHLTIETG